MAMRQVYSDKVWKAIRELWEVSPKTTSLKMILEQVGDALGQKLPAEAVVYRRLKRER